MTVSNEDQVLILNISYGPEHTHITNKVIMWTINKSDESDDTEIRGEYQRQLTDHIVHTLKSSLTREGDPKGGGFNAATNELVTHNTLWTSTYLHE